MDLSEHNSRAWDQYVEEGSEFTRPVDPQLVEFARQGEVALYLSLNRAAPPDWLPALPGKDVLALAAGGGQQGPLLAAAGANVTVFDNSPRQLAQDRLVAEREGLALNLVEGDMRDLSRFPDHSFDLVVNPISNLYIPELQPLWEALYRVLRPGGLLLAGFMNPVFYIFDRDRMDEDGLLVVKNRLPYSDLTSPDPAARQRYIDEGWALEFGHTLEQQIGGLLEAGFILTGFYEDRDYRSPLDDYLPIYIAVRAVKKA